jgi:uncharacterized membrane protein YhaH (DUF805 family)
MSNLLDLLFTFGGRINRAKWWLGLVVLIVASMAGTALFRPGVFSANPEAAPPSWLDTAWQLAWLVPATAITVKRFNDRDWPDSLGYAFGVLGAFTQLAPYAGLKIDPTAGGIGAPLFWAISAAYLFAIVENGFLRGTRGPNRHGPDPLEPRPS